MNRRLCAWVGSIVFCVAFGSSAIAQGLPGPAAGTGGGGAAGAAAPAAPAAPLGPQIPPAAFVAPDANQYAADFRAFIQFQLKQLAGTDYAAQTTARDALRRALARGATPSYYLIFAKEWVKQASALLGTNPPPPLGVRLNIAIVTALLTDNGQTMDRTAGEPLTESLVDKLTSDSSASVALWGIKAAGPLVQMLMQMPAVGNKPALTASPLLNTIVGAIRKHQSSELQGYLAQEAYNDLLVRSIASLAPGQLAPLQPPLVPAILDILEVRVNSYHDGAIPCPGAEREIATFLASQYAAVPVSLQHRMVQLLVNLEVYAGDRSNQYVLIKPDLAQLREMLKYATSALSVIANNSAADQKLGWLKGVPPAASPQQIQQHTQEVPDILKPVFPWLTAPAPIPPMPEPELPKTTPAPAGTAAQG